MLRIFWRFISGGISSCQKQRNKKKAKSELTYVQCEASGVLDPKVTWGATLFDSVDLALDGYGDEQLKNRAAIFLSGILHVESNTSEKCQSYGECAACTAWTQTINIKLSMYSVLLLVHEPTPLLYSRKHQLFYTHAM